MLKLGSLFDGIGGFPLAASRAGIVPIWASEIDKTAISITKRHFPQMEHLGDITKIDCAKITRCPDIVTFGSPCQDLSIAGKRAGIAGARSGLFAEAIRVIKGMRSEYGKPTFIIWENVPGVFSSNRGEDFRAVLEEIARIAEDVAIPGCSGNGGTWSHAGAIMGDGWSITWRILDAQYWGVPQRRRRIFLVADFGSECAGEILFKPNGLRGDTKESGEAREEITGSVTRGFGETGFGKWREGIQCLAADGENRPSRPHNVVCDAREDAAVWPDKTGSLVARADSSPCIDRGQPFVVDFGREGDRIHMNPKTAKTLKDGGGGAAKMGLYCLPLHDNATRFHDGSAHGFGVGKNGDPCPTLDTVCRHSVAVGIDEESNFLNEKMGTLRAHETGRHEHAVATFALQSFGEYKPAGIASTMRNRDHKDSTDLISDSYAVRRLTPVECERLQGFPDGWTEYGHDGTRISDSARYRALGNSVAIPCVQYIMDNIASALERAPCVS
jgi:DNA (cytosine-5)-methyltransferase 1